MEFKKIVFLSIFFISIIAVSFVVFAEEAPRAGVESVVIASSQPIPEQEKSDTQWAWGEVMNLDIPAKSFTIKYLDYETDQEKELVLVADDKTTFENVKGLDELKLKDTLSIDYAAGADNKNVAKNISLEALDAAPVLTPETPVKEEVKSAEPILGPVTVPGSPVLVSPEAMAPVIAPATEPAPRAIETELPSVAPVSELPAETSSQAQ